MHRIAASRRYQASPREIRTRWTWRDVLEAHWVLDAFEEVER